MAQEKSSEPVTVHFAKTHLSRLLARVEKGETVIIARGKMPVARLSPVAPRRAGIFKGKIKIGPEFFEPLLDEELARWE
jgi:prevent-host-death family protein